MLLSRPNYKDSQETDSFSFYPLKEKSNAISYQDRKGIQVFGMITGVTMKGIE